MDLHEMCLLCMHPSRKVPNIKARVASLYTSRLNKLQCQGTCPDSLGGPSHQSFLDILQPGPADGATLTMAGGWQGVTLRVRRLETVNLYQILLCNVVGDQECRHILALITLQLNDLS